MKIVVFDLDGTLVPFNSFPRWVLFLMKSAIINMSLGLLLRIIWNLGLRKLRFLGHSDFKKNIMELEYDEEIDRSFAEYLVGQIDPLVLQDINKLDAEDRLIVSTAAPSNYVRFFVLKTSFYINDFFCSVLEYGDLRENYSISKVDNFIKTYGDKSCDVFYTDHHEDLPMMQYSKKVVLVRPSQLTLEIVESGSVNLVQIV